MRAYLAVAGLGARQGAGRQMKGTGTPRGGPIEVGAGLEVLLPPLKLSKKKKKQRKNPMKIWVLDCLINQSVSFLICITSNTISLRLYFLFFLCVDLVCNDDDIKSRIGLIIAFYSHR